MCRNDCEWQSYKNKKYIYCRKNYHYLHVEWSKVIISFSLRNCFKPGLFSLSWPWTSIFILIVLALSWCCKALYFEGEVSLPLNFFITLLLQKLYGFWADFLFGNLSTACLLHVTRLRIQSCFLQYALVSPRKVHFFSIIFFIMLMSLHISTN